MCKHLYSVLQLCFALNLLACGSCFAFCVPMQAHAVWPLLYLLLLAHGTSRLDTQLLRLLLAASSARSSRTDITAHLQVLGLDVLSLPIRDCGSFAADPAAALSGSIDKRRGHKDNL